MKLKVKCDECGIEGSPAEIKFSVIYERDFCFACEKKVTLLNLKQERLVKQTWLDATLLKELAELDAQIAELEKDDGNL